MITSDLVCDCCKQPVEDGKKCIITAGIATPYRQEVLDALLRPYTAKRLVYDEPKCFCSYLCFRLAYDIEMMPEEIEKAKIRLWGLNDK